MRKSPGVPDLVGAPSLDFTSSTTPPFFRRILGSLGQPRDAQHAISLCRSLLSERGDASGARLAAEILAAYQTLKTQAREMFFDLLADQFSPVDGEVRRAVDAYREEPSRASLRGLQAAVESPRQELFRRLNLASGATAVLVEMRKQLLHTLREHPERTEIDADLVHLFRSWFNGGFLILRRIDWRTSALTLERLILYEAVHQIQGWRDLRRRLESDRRCYGFFHPALPDEPLIFIEVALTRVMSAAIGPLIDPDSAVVDPALAKCAIFYSITNCQEGLRGVSLGNYLIKQVVEDLGREFPRLRTFATLSPVPGFRHWLQTATSSSARERRRAELEIWLASLETEGDSLTDASVSPQLRQDLIGLCAYYLLHARDGEVPLDPVARFHLANGASLVRLNWLGDTSAAGKRRSVGLMANYLYRGADVDRNAEAFAKDRKIVASQEIVRLARQSLVAHVNGNSSSPPDIDTEVRA